MNVRLVDWRTLPASVLAPAWRAESARWRDELCWDIGPTMTLLEPARVLGRVPGYAAIDERGALAGWICFVLQRQALQIAMLAAVSPEATALLLDAVASSAAAGQADLHAICVPDFAAGLPAALGDRGFDVVRYRYLAWEADGASAPSHPSAAPLRLWRGGDALPFARLCARAYAGSSVLRPFAPHDRWEEWTDYVDGLIAGPGCGRLLPDASFVSSTPDGRLDGAVVTTDLGAGAAHLAQVVVDPPARRRGLAAALVARALEAATAAGAARVTLLVAETNTPAVALYERMGFVDRAAFVVAVDRQPRRSTSLAVAAGGASTRR